MSKSVLVVAAHADDEVLGCGGTIAKFSDQGASVNVVFLSDGVNSRANINHGALEALERREIAAKKACDILGVKSVSFRNYPDNKMDTVALLEVTKTIEEIIITFQPDIILTHYFGDLNIDHRISYEAVVTACRPQFNHSVKTILSFEVPSSTEWQLPGNFPAFSPNWYEDISDTFERKIAALDAYASEMREWPHPRSLKGVTALARWRGATIGVDAAEAFVLGRHIK